MSALSSRHLMYMVLSSEGLWIFEWHVLRNAVGFVEVGRRIHIQGDSTRKVCKLFQTAIELVKSASVNWNGFCILNHI
jgi:hypothetical protein